MRPLILASASPRRRQLLGALGIEFEVVVPEVEELREGDPAEVVLANARRKAQAGAELAAGALVLAVDTDVALDGSLLGKAETEDQARARLEALSGRVHEVLSGVVLLGELSVGLLDVLGRSVLTDPEDRIEVLLEPVLRAHSVHLLD